MSDYMSQRERLRRIGEVLLRGVYLHLDAAENPETVEDEPEESNHRSAVEGPGPNSAPSAKLQPARLRGRAPLNEAQT